MDMTAQDQRLLDCHAAWCHGVLTLEELYQEVWRAYPEPTEEEQILRAHATALGEAARRMMEQRIVAAIRTDIN
jgi:hypothetical protein